MGTKIIPWSKNQEPLRAIVSGGGTGGHIYPALAIAEALHQRYQAQILYMGARQNPQGGPPREQELAQHAGWPYIGVTASGLHRRSPRIVLDILENYRGTWQAYRQIRQFAPQIVIGTGGYAMAPVLRAATALRIPTLLHEQNAYPGWANRYLAGKVDTVCLSFEAARSYFPARSHTVLTGLPVRQAVCQTSRAQAQQFFGLEKETRNLPTLLVTGGSQGAQSLNQALCASYQPLLAAGLRIIHLCGEANAEFCFEAAQALPQQENLLVLPYLKEMEHALALADLVVGRAGASFLAEIAVRGLPAVLVPYPYAANDHQTKNAASFEEAGAALMVKNRDLQGDTLCKLVLELMNDSPRRQQMSAAARSLARPQAIEEIMGQIERLL